MRERENTMSQRRRKRDTISIRSNIACCSVRLKIFGPRQGVKHQGALSPDAARYLAADLIAAAKEVEAEQARRREMAEAAAHNMASHGTLFPARVED
jgi:hypothetical protein